ncbi:unnamed protein product, partial [Symbiodinium necroappetens]
TRTRGGRVAPRAFARTPPQPLPSARIANIALRMSAVRRRWTTRRDSREQHGIGVQLQEGFRV